MSVRMPKLVIDEGILLVDAYFRLQEVTLASTKKDIIEELSANMKHLPFFPQLRDEPAFHSVEGMNLCLSSVGTIDPDSRCTYGRGSILQKKLFDYYGDKKLLLRKIAESIIRLSDEQFTIDPTTSEFMGGQLIASYHKHLEYNNKTVKAVKKQNIAINNAACSLCGENLSERYHNAFDLMEVHINIGIEEYSKPVNISPANTVLLCPVCHKLVHSEPMLYNIENAKENLRNSLR